MRKNGCFLRVSDVTVVSGRANYNEYNLNLNSIIDPRI